LAPEDIAKKSPFDYPTIYWLKHAMGVPPGPHSTSLSKALWERVRDFFWDREGAIFVDWLSVVDVGSAGWPYKSDRDTPKSACLCRSCKGRVNNCLHVAASYGLQDIFRWAHPDGLNFDITDRDGATPLMHAIQMGNEDITRALLDKGVDINSTVCKASASGRDCDGECGANGWTALTYAGFHRRPEMMKFLLKQPGIEVDRMSHGNTALGVIISCGCNSEMELLIGAGAKVAVYGKAVVEIPSATDHPN
jgi:ankyrin repeat protein